MASGEFVDIFIEFGFEPVHWICPNWRFICLPWRERNLQSSFDTNWGCFPHRWWDSLKRDGQLVSSNIAPIWIWRIQWHGIVWICTPWAWRTFQIIRFGFEYNWFYWTRLCSIPMTLTWAIFLTVQKIKLYMDSMLRFGKTPYLYPLYGLGELPQDLLGLSAIYGGVYMLGIKFEGFEMIKPVNGSVEFALKVVKCSSVPEESFVILLMHLKGFAYLKGSFDICLFDHPIKSAADSCQIILPQKQLNRHHDIYISCLSAGHNVCPSGYFLAQISTIVETANPEQEIAPALTLSRSHFGKVCFHLQLVRSPDGWPCWWHFRVEISWFFDAFRKCLWGCEEHLQSHFWKGTSSCCASSAEEEQATWTGKSVNTNGGNTILLVIITSPKCFLWNSEV